MATVEGGLQEKEQHDLPPLQKEAFDFSLVKRNAMLAASGFKAPTFMKTGTTIAGLIFKDGVVLGADTRATEGSIVADKNCAKIHHISSKIWSAQQPHTPPVHTQQSRPSSLHIADRLPLLRLPVPGVSGAVVRARPLIRRT